MTLVSSLYKTEAVNLRQQGKTYTEILAVIPVAKSTLAGWLQDVGLSKKQQQNITEKRVAARLRGAKARHEAKVRLVEEINKKTKADITHISDRELWLMGIMLYWAEGTKEKSHHPGTGLRFANSDPLMIRLFLVWLLRVCKVEKERVCFALYVHENVRGRLSEIKDYWVKQTGFSEDHFLYVYFKKNKINTLRKNIGNTYFGLLNVQVKTSSLLVRKIDGWVQAIADKILPGGVFGNTPAFEAGDTRFEP